LRVFVVENNTDTRIVLGLLLQQLGHTTDNASSVAEALDEMRARPYDVLVSDIGLPDGTGWDLMASLGDARPPYAIAMSGFGSEQDMARSRAVGFRHHLLKPVEPGRIEALLDEAADVLADRVDGTTGGGAARDGPATVPPGDGNARPEDAGAPPPAPADEAARAEGPARAIRSRSGRPP